MEGITERKEVGRETDRRQRMQRNENEYVERVSFMQYKMLKTMKDFLIRISFRAVIWISVLKGKKQSLLFYSKLHMRPQTVSSLLIIPLQTEISRG